jgi:UDP-N-acetylmuramate dehydrogenase
MDMADPVRFTPCGLRGELRLDEPMRKHTSWRAGGPAQRFYVPRDLADLAEFLRSLPPGEPLFVVGLGSNLLVRDGGVRGTVVLTHGALRELRLEGCDEHGGELYAEAGVPGAKVARFAALHDLEGAEFLAGIPGTVGGALAMNAGCYGRETWEVVARVRTIDRIATLRERGPGDYDVGYRHVALKAAAEEWFVGAWLRLPAGSGDASRGRIKDLLARRVASQPLNLPNAGSVFRNPARDFAARLIESCGLKGYQAGGAMVSPKHANFIVNAGAATAADIESLIEHCRQTVFERTGILLEREVRIIGEPA